MQTSLADFIRDTHEGREADAILRSCVHCGFCNATCPTYQLLGDELDGPRGRIYLIKQFLEGEASGEVTRQHLDRCLTCRSCETTCPSGVQYARLADIGRELTEKTVPRPALSKALRMTLRQVVPYRKRIAPVLAMGRWVRRALPSSLRAKVPPRQRPGPWPVARHTRRMLALGTCVQAAATPRTDAAAARVLDRLGVSLLAMPQTGCCGALSQHLGAVDEARAQARRNIDAWWPEIERGAEAIVVSASGCAVTVKDYAALLAQDPTYADKAARVSAMARDLAEVIADEPIEDRLTLQEPTTPTAVHQPCTQRHGERLPDRVNGILTRLGASLTPTVDDHLCCGSAGTYSILQPKLANQLRTNKLAALQGGAPARIVTANIGCQLHLAGGTRTAVRHWIEVLDPWSER